MRELRRLNAIGTVRGMREARARPPATGRPIENPEAARHGCARAARASAVLEDYVELIDDLLRQHGEARSSDLARRLGVAHPTVIKGIARLKALGLARSEPYRSVFLTEAGHQLADRVRTRHRLVVALLVAVGVPPDIAESDAEGIEHHVSAATLEAFAIFLGENPESQT